MRLALVSDIHSNLQALSAVLDYIDGDGVDDIWCLGDIVGYGADPKLCLDLVRDRCSVIVMGNHDLAVASEPAEAYLPRDGRKAARHNRAALNAADLTFLGSLPYSAVLDGCMCVHATPATPELWIRLTSFQLAQDQFQAFEEAICFIGHTHSPAIFSDRLGVIIVRPGHRYLVNVGSVGQPRDGDPRACIGLFDSDAFSFRIERIEYDIEAAVERIDEEGLPRRLGERLRLGK